MPFLQVILDVSLGRRLKQGFLLVVFELPRKTLVGLSGLGQFALHGLKLGGEAALVFLAGDGEDVDVVLGHGSDILLALGQFLVEQTPQPRALILVNLHLQTQLGLRGHLQRLLNFFQFLHHLFVIRSGFAKLSLESLVRYLLQNLGFDPLLALV